MGLDRLIVMGMTALATGTGASALLTHAALADPARAISMWEMSWKGEGGRGEGYVERERMIARSYAHACFSTQNVAPVDELDYAAATSSPNEKIEGDAFIEIPCAGGAECVSVEYGSVWLSAEECGDNDVEREKRAYFSLPSIRSKAAERVVEEFRKKE